MTRFCSFRIDLVYVSEPAKIGHKYIMYLVKTLNSSAAKGKPRGIDVFAFCPGGSGAFFCCCTEARRPVLQMCMVEGESPGEARPKGVVGVHGWREVVTVKQGVSVSESQSGDYEAALIYEVELPARALMQR